jgi:hypothetical protein
VRDGDPRISFDKLEQELGARFRRWRKLEVDSAGDETAVRVNAPGI